MVDGAVELALPEVLSLSSNYQETMEFIEALRNPALIRRKRLNLDFKTLRRVSPAAALVLAAELDRWRQLKNLRPRVLDIDEWDPTVRRLLQQMGLFDLLRVRNPPPPLALQEPTIHFIKFCSSREVVGRLASELRKALERYVGQIEGWRFLYEGIQEAMTNVRHHAYPRSRYMPDRLLPNQWWMGGAYDERNEQLRATFFDQGVGIPATIARTIGRDRLTEFLAKIGLVDVDASRIKAAMEFGASQTGQPYRGKGLREIREFIERSRMGSLRILSGTGEYIYSYDGKEATELLATHSPSIGGTLIQWQASVKREAS